MDVDDDEDDDGCLSSQEGGTLKGHLKNHLMVSFPSFLSFLYACP